jgi:hypothetical protein
MDDVAQNPFTTCVNIIVQRLDCVAARVGAPRSCSAPPVTITASLEQCHAEIRATRDA